MPEEILDALSTSECGEKSQIDSQHHESSPRSPLLLNVNKDAVLGPVMPPGVTIVSSADDFAIVVYGRTSSLLFSSVGLHLADLKTKVGKLGRPSKSFMKYQENLIDEHSQIVSSCCSGIIITNIWETF